MERVSVERIHCSNQLAFDVLKAIAFVQRGANKDVGDLIRVRYCSTEAYSDEGARSGSASLNSLTLSDKETACG